MRNHSSAAAISASALVADTNSHIFTELPAQMKYARFVEVR